MKLRRIVIGVAAVLVIAAAASVASAWHQGYRAYVVQTGSMVPTFRPGDAVCDGRRPADTALATPITVAIGGDRASPIDSSRSTSRACSTPRATRTGPRTSGQLPPTRVRAWSTGCCRRWATSWSSCVRSTGVAGVMTSALSLILLWGICFPAEQDTRLHRPHRGCPASVARSCASRGRGRPARRRLPSPIRPCSRSPSAGCHRCHHLGAGCRRRHRHRVRDASGGRGLLGSARPIGPAPKTWNVRRSRDTADGAARPASKVARLVRIETCCPETWATVAPGRVARWEGMTDSAAAGPSLPAEPCWAAAPRWGRRAHPRPDRWCGRGRHPAGLAAGERRRRRGRWRDLGPDHRAAGRQERPLGARRRGP